MSHRPLRHRVLGAAAVAVIGTGLTVPTITEAGHAAAAECRSSSTVKKSLIVDYNFQKSVTPDVGQSTSVTYSLGLNTTSIGNPYIQGVWDIPPAALRDVKPTVKVRAFTLLGGVLGGGAFGDLLQESEVKPEGVTKDGISWKITHTGWAIFSGQAHVASFTYKLPNSIKPGTQLQSGGAAFKATPKPPLGYLEFPNLTACTTVRGKNAGEFIGGSVDSNGLGSSDGQLSSTGNLGDVLGGMFG